MKPTSTKKEEKTMIIALVEYINKNGKASVKGFSNEAELSEFVGKLEAKGTKHIVTRL